MTDYLYFQSLVQYRIPVINGVAGNPEVLKKFTSPIKGTQGQTRKVKKVDLVVEEVGEIEL